MELKQIDVDWLYRFNSGENKDEFFVEGIIDPFKIPKQDLIFVLEHAVGQFTEADLEEIVQPKFICPNGVSCHDVLDAVKVIKQFGRPKEEIVADLCLEKYFQLQYSETYPIGKKEVAPVIEY